MNDDTKDVNVSKRTRSPAYPTTGLEDALARAKIIWEEDGQKETYLSSLAQHWDYNVKSSSAAQLVAALKKYGLLDDVPNKPACYRLSQSAIRIFSDESSNSPEREALLKKAALSPKIYADLWRKYEGDLPSETTIKTHLIADLSFNKDVVDKLIKDFKATITFSKLSSNDKLPDVTPETVESEESKKPLFQQRHVIDSLRVIPPIPQMREFSFPLPTGVATLKVPFPLTEDDFSNLLNALTAFRSGLVKKDEPVSLENVEGWKEKAKALAELGAEFNLMGFDFSFDVEAVKEIALQNNLDVRLDLPRSMALFRKRPEKR